MLKRWKFLLVSLGVLVMSACQSDANHPHIKLNPHPKMRYEITLTIKDAPGPFDSIKGYMLYKVDMNRPGFAGGCLL